MTPQQIDRWLLNNVLARSRVFRVALSDCVDEFGNGYDGSHFFIRALKRGEDFDSVFAALKGHYARHPIRSFNQVVGRRIDDPAGDQYFCPWEDGRIRPLAKFSASHKVGPTPDDALAPIVRRLLGVLAEIRSHGLRQRSLVDGFPQVIPIIDVSGCRRYILRDGQHRAAALAHLGYETMLVTHTADHWRPSRAYRAVSSALRRLRGASAPYSEGSPLREVREDEVERWPHVRDGRVAAEDALRYFRALYGRRPARCGGETRMESPC